jgi:hypothetical protein
MATLATSNVSELNQDPHFHATLEDQYRQRHIANDYYRTDFEAGLKQGRQYKVQDELVVESKEITGHEQVVYKERGASEQTFTITKAQGVQEKIFNFDAVASEFDVAKTILSNGVYQMHNKIDKYLFQKLYDNAQNIQTAIDLTALSTNAAKGNAIYSALMDATAFLDFTDVGQDKKAAFGRMTKRYLKDADKLTDSTTISQADMRAGVLGMCDGIRIDNTNNIYQGSSTYTVYNKGGSAVGDRTLTVDNNGSGNITKPEAGDTFTNVVTGVEETYTILTVKEVTKNEEYVITIDKPLGTLIADDASMTVTGFHTDYIPVVYGAPGQAVIQQDPQFEVLPDPDYRAKLLRGDAIYDAFLSTEGARRVSIIPVIFRTVA